jgi:hypothetical protein
VRDEGAIGAAEILRLHADRLGLGLGLDRLVDAHASIPGAMHASWLMRVREGRAAGQLVRQRLRPAQAARGLASRLKKPQRSPSSALMLRPV